MLTAEQLKARKRKNAGRVETVDTSWGDSFGIRHLNVIERDQYNLRAFNEKGEFDKSRVYGAKALLLAMTLCDEGGKPVFVQPTDNPVDRWDIEAVCEAFESDEIDELFEKAQAMNGLAPKAKETAGGNS